MSVNPIRGLHPVVVTLAVAWMFGCQAVRATEESSPALVAFGIGGTHRTGEWTPVTIQVPQVAGGQIRIAVEDPDGQFVASPPILVPSDTRTVSTCVRPGRPLARLRIGPAGPQADSTFVALEPPSGDTIPSTSPLVLVVGHVPAADSAARLISGDDTTMRVIRLDKQAETIVHEPRAFDAFDAAILCGSRLADMPPSTLVALDGWVRQGGRLIVSAGATAMALASAEDPVCHWLPGTAPRLVPLRRAGALEAFARASGLTSRIPASGLMVPRFESPAGIHGVVQVFEGASARELPLVVRKAHGFGTITWIGIDLDEPWCANWNGCDRLIAALFGGRRDADTVTPAAGNNARQVLDLSGQLRVAIDQFPAEGGRPATLPIPFEIIAAVGILYCITLYPIDWWIVRRSGWPGLSWFTLPLAVSTFAAGVWSLSRGCGQDAPARARAADIVDFDSASGLVRGSSWAAVRSPDNAKLSLGARPASSSAVRNGDVATSWFADRGAGFGSMDSVLAHPSLAASDYSYGMSLADLDAVPIAASSSCLFEMRWTGQAERAGGHAAIAESSLARDPRGLLSGHVTSRLPFAIERCWLVHGGWLYDVGRMEPGGTYDTEAGRGPRSLTAALTRLAAVRDRDRAERWDPASTDVARILEIIGLHEAAGGENYTRLSPGRLGRLDLSQLLDADRSILVGIVEASPASEWRVTTQPVGRQPETIAVERAAETIVRVVVPVEMTAASEESSP